MPVSTVSATINIAPVVVQTFFRHYRNKARKKKDGEKGEKPTDSFLFDEAFHIVKAFIHLGTENTVESLQEFTNTHVPHPYWATVIPVNIPLSTCNQAADALTSWFSGEELRDIVGGERWWQVRGLNGIDAEWVAMDDDVDAMKPEAERNIEEKKAREKQQKAKLKKGIWVEEDMAGIDKLDRIMLYVHGGGYFWGSINTHRYQIIRFARKMAGRCFAVNYRKAPQYPWPCPLQDVLAAYLFLIRPPQNAAHSAVNPAQIVIAGDSAGGGLSITCLTILRDLGIPMPAGGVMISPWVDLTHSFPSILKSFDTDILPPHGFIHKPSTLWPVPAMTTARAVPTNPVPTNIAHIAQDRSKAQQDLAVGKERSDSKSLFDQTKEAVGHRDGSSGTEKNVGKGTQSSGDNSEGETLGDTIGKDRSEVKPELEALPQKRDTRFIKVAMSSSDEAVLELRSQIQLYATNELSGCQNQSGQLTHPLVSPVLQGSLGGLCPLYIMAGDGEMLRDEIIYLAHRAANPTEYPIRKELLEGPRQAENARKYTKPTMVRLQVFDGLCHVGPTVFSFTQQSTYAYRAIAEFVTYVTSHSPEDVAKRPFPQTVLPKKNPVTFDNPSLQIPPSPPSTVSTPEIGASNHQTGCHAAPSQAGSYMNVAGKTPSTSCSSVDAKRDSSVESMVRERVDVRGHLRPMEPPFELEALQVPPEEVGLIKEAPVRRWLSGQEQWDARFKRSAERAELKRKKLEHTAEKLMQHLNNRRQRQEEPPINQDDALQNPDNGGGNDRRWGPLDLVEDNPPPSAIAGRRDTPDALALLKIYFAPPDFRPRKLSAGDAVRAALGRKVAPVRPHRQSPSEQQITKTMLPVHGLSMWSGLMSYFLKKSTQKATQKTKSFKDGVTGGSGNSE